MADFDFTKTYFIKVNNNHNGYDFDHKGYPLSYPTRSGSSPKQCIPFNGFNFMPVNPDQAFFIPVSMDDAEKYEKRSRGTGQNGYVSRWYIRLSICSPWISIWNCQKENTMFSTWRTYIARH